VPVGESEAFCGDSVDVGPAMAHETALQHDRLLMPVSSPQMIRMSGWQLGIVVLLDVVR